MSYAIEVIGWTGALLMLLSYALISAGRLSGDSPAYQVMNVLGAAGFVVNSGWNGAYPSATLNVIWMGIGLAALWQRRRARIGLSGKVVVDGAVE